MGDINVYQIDVTGTPKAKGSMRSYVRGKRAIITNSNPATKTWEDIVEAAVSKTWVGGPVEGPVVVILAFFFHRPAMHFKMVKGIRTLKQDAPTEKVTKPDIDKLTRCILDALTGVVYRDDCQVTSVVASKHYTITQEYQLDDGEGVSIKVITGDIITETDSMNIIDLGDLQ